MEFDVNDTFSFVVAPLPRAQGNIGPFVIDLAKQTVSCRGEKIHLTEKEFQMLELLALRPDTTVTKEMFMAHLYGGRNEPELKIIDVFMCKLRKKLGAANDGEHYIDTIWGRGYTLNAPEGSALPGRPHQGNDVFAALSPIMKDTSLAAPFRRESAPFNALAPLVFNTGVDLAPARQNLVWCRLD